MLRSPSIPAPITAWGPWARYMAHYLGMISQIDDAVAALQAPPLEAGTLAQIDALLAGH